jgi:hypothetical protein
MNKPLHVLFSCTLLVSLLIHLQFRKKHFQEVDSTLPYFLFQDFPNNCFDYANWSYVEDSSALSDFVIHQFIKEQSNELKITNEVVDAKAHFQADDAEFNFVELGKQLKQARYCDSVLLQMLRIQANDWKGFDSNSMRGRINQMMDSAQYQNLFDKPFDSTLFTVNTRRLISRALKGEKLRYFEQAQINRAILEHFYPSAFTKLVVKEIKSRRLKFFYLWRILNIHRVIEWKANKYITASFQFSYSSTYFPAVGFVYYFILDHTNNFNAFFDTAQILTIFLFHLSALLLVLTFLKMQFSPFAAISSGIIFLFSITMYSYANHLGSTIWVIFTSLIWLFFYAKMLGANTRKQLLIISLVSSCLLLFNYLILFYWAAYMLVKTITIWKDQSKPKLKALFSLYFSQSFFALTTLFVIVFFYQPGQGNRGTVKSVAEFAYVFLNYFSFFNQNIFLTLLQLLFVGTCLFISVRLGYRYLQQKETAFYFQKELIHFVIALLAIYAVTLVTQQLGFAASRHVLWLTPIFFLSFAYSLQHLSFKKAFLPFGMTMTIVLLGFLGLNLRQKQTVNNKKFDWYSKKDIHQYLVHDYLFEVYYNLKDRNLPAVFTFNIAQLEKGKRYVYISQKRPLSDLIEKQKEELAVSKVNINIINTEETKSDVRFLAYSSGRFLQDHANSIYVTEFVVE